MWGRCGVYGLFLGMVNMYLKFYKLNEYPFNMTADPYFFFSSQSHIDAMFNILYGIQQRKGIIVLTGEIGTGKTMLCRKLLNQKNKNIKYAFVLNTHYNELELLQVIAQDFGLKVKNYDKFILINMLNKFLLKQSKKGNNVVIVIDEAQNLTVTQLEQIRLLSNLETEKNKLLQILLVGQPELEEKLKLHEIRQLRQRIGIYYRISALEKNDILPYIKHRISKALIHDKVAFNLIFTEQAIEMIYHFTKGLPRMINILCDRALLAAFVNETTLIDHSIIENCAKEVCFEYHL